jgi:hypothetical protein
MHINCWHDYMQDRLAEEVEGWSEAKRRPAVTERNGLLAGAKRRVLE